MIIDGINVSECEFFSDIQECPDNINGGYYIQHNYCGLNGDNYCICKENKQCYYKQWQRLKQENEKLKAEIEKSREAYSRLQKMYNENCDYTGDLKTENERLKEYEYYYLDKYADARSALKEINLIIDELKQQYDYMSDYSEIKEIENKINEVLK